MIKLSVGRPVAVAMAYFALAFLGARAWLNIPVELMPNASLPRLSVNGSWGGASPETVEAFLTSPLEAEIQLVEGVEKVTSMSYEGRAEIDVLFNRDTDMDFARLDLAERLAKLEESVLPPGVTGVSVSQYVPQEFQQSQNRALMGYTFTGPRTLASLREHLVDVVVPQLSQIPGVGLVSVSGGRERILEVELDKEVMAALGVSTSDVSSKLRSLDLVREAGAIREGEQQWTVTIRNRPASVEDISEAVVSTDGERVVRISDIAVAVRHTYEDAWQHYRVNARPAVRMNILKEIGSNSVEVADRVKERMERVKGLNPPNTRFILDRDESEEIRRDMADKRTRAAISMLVVFAVLFLFLSIRASLVVFATIFFSVLIAINVIYFAGFTLNRFTLMGLAAGFGLYVDNSIVVLENIYRRWQAGDSSRDAILKGARHVVLPILAATLTTLIVYAPWLYLTGEQRVYYLPMGIMIVLSVIGSVLVAFTFIPALIGKLLPQRDPSVLDGVPRHEPFYQRFYRGLVTRTLKWPWVTVFVPILLLAGSWYLFDRNVVRGRVWFGGGSQSSFISISIELPRGSDIDRTDQLTKFFEERLLQMPEIKDFTTNVYATNSRTIVTFPEHLEYTDVPVRIKEQLFAYSLGFARAEVRVYGYGPSFYGGGGGGGGNYSIQILGYNYEQVRDIAEVLGARLRRQARIRDVDTNASFRSWGRDRATEFAVIIHRDRAAQHGVSVSHLVTEINSAIQGRVASGEAIKMGGDEIPYAVKLEGYREVDLHELRKTLVVTPAGDAIRLGELISIEERNLLSAIRREDQQYERTVRYEFRGPYKLGDLVHTSFIDATDVPPGYTVKKASGYNWSREDQREIMMVLLVAIFLVFMVTSALFESIWLPLCVLLTVPMALIGVFLIFFYTNAHFTREAYIGVIMMGGIVVNNAILLVDHINRVRRETGLALKRAILKGTMERVRPILMTSTTTIGALLPLVLFSPSANANIWNALALTLIGGLIASTFLVLTVTPALYLLFTRGKAGVVEGVPVGGAMDGGAGAAGPAGGAHA